MRTNIDIDDGLLKEAFSVSHPRTKKDLIHDALTEYIRVKKRKDMTELAGFIELQLLKPHANEMPDFYCP